jgi:DNA-binding GntR family transcriptional regulator
MVLSKTKNEAAYETLRNDIIVGRLKPGQKINMSEIAKKLGLSESPIREAIRRLESDRLVEFTPHIGAVVNKIDEREFIETYLIRIELEPLSTRLAVPYLTSKDIEYLEKKNKEMEIAFKENSPEKLGALNKDFHLRIYKAAPFPHLYKLIKDLWLKVERTQSVFAYVPGRAKASVAEHSQIIEALKSKDQLAAEELTKQQKSRTMKALQKYIQKHFDDFGNQLK